MEVCCADYSCPGGTRYDGSSVTGKSGQYVCGKTGTSWQCRSATKKGEIKEAKGQWEDTGYPCDYECPGGVNYRGQSFTGSMNEIVCGQSRTYYKCVRGSTPGIGQWQDTGVACRFIKLRPVSQQGNW